MKLLSKTILTEQDIINTYNKNQRNQVKLYYRYKAIKKQNPSFGYKRIAKLMNQPYGKTRWWHSKKHLPVPIQTVNWLKEKHLLPLKLNHPKFILIARIFGALYGDGGIFKNLNGIFLSSSELQAVKDFGHDLKLIFGDKIENNHRIIEAGEYGHSWCYQNTNRKIIRFFQALGTPLGKKSHQELFIPEWIFKKEEIVDEFFGAFIGGEMGIPKVHISQRYLNTLDIGVCSNIKFKENRYHFLNQVRKYFDLKGIKTGKISLNFNQKDQETLIFRLLLSTTFENVLNFLTLTKIRYCQYKQEKLINTLNEFGQIKLERYKDLLQMDYSANTALKLLKISEAMLYILEEELPLKHENFIEKSETSINFTSNPINCTIT